MRPFDDTTSEIDECSSERMNFRTRPRIKRANQRVAALSGVDDSIFTMNAAYLASRHVTRHPNGHFVLEARADREFPDAESWAAIRSYLDKVRACDAATKAGYAVWRGYRREMRSGAFAGQA